MTNSQRLATVRSAIEGYLANQVDQQGSVSSDNGIETDSSIVTESILIRDEHYCGRRFRTSTHRAVWFIEEDQVKIYTADQRLCCVLSADEIDAAAEMDADPAPHVISMHTHQADSGNHTAPDSSEEIRRAA